MAYNTAAFKAVTTEKLHIVATVIDINFLHVAKLAIFSYLAGVCRMYINNGYPCSYVVNDPPPCIGMH